MKKWAFIFSIALLAVSCNSLLKSKPAGTLSEEKMTEVLIDIHITEAILRIGNDSLVKLNDTTDIRNRFAQVFRKHDIEPDDFNRMLNKVEEPVEIQYFDSTKYPVSSFK